MVSNYTYPNYIQSPQPFNANMQPSSVQGGQIQRYWKGRPVSCFEEVQGGSIDWDGSLHIFPDITHKQIYTKQVMMDGSCSVKRYVEQPIQENVSSQADEPVSNKLLKQLEEKVVMLEQQLKGIVNESKSNATVPNVRTA